MKQIFGVSDLHSKRTLFIALFFCAKELNRVRKAALAYGFYEVFQCLSEMLSKELVQSGSTYSPECLFQLTHVIQCLNSNEYKNIRKDIQPITAASIQPHQHKQQQQQQKHAQPPTGHGFNQRRQK